jgi:hypothetical protein
MMMVLMPGGGCPYRAWGIDIFSFWFPVIYHGQALSMGEERSTRTFPIVNDPSQRLYEFQRIARVMDRAIACLVLVLVSLVLVSLVLVSLVVA